MSIANHQTVMKIEELTIGYEFGKEPILQNQYIRSLLMTMVGSVLMGMIEPKWVSGYT
jgi:hypothetical protein